MPLGPVVVCGGGEVGSETAEFISQTNRNVTVLEMKDQILMDMVALNMVVLLERMISQQINIITNAKVSSISNGQVTYLDKENKEITIPAVSVVKAFGYTAYNPLQKVAEENCKEVYVVGSAVKAGDAMTATQEGYQAALKL